MEAMATIYPVTLEELQNIPGVGGMMMDVLEDVLSNTPHIKLIYAIPTFQNPTAKNRPATGPAFRCICRSGHAHTAAAVHGARSQAAVSYTHLDVYKRQ